MTNRIIHNWALPEDQNWICSQIHSPIFNPINAQWELDVTFHQEKNRSCQETLSLNFATLPTLRLGNVYRNGKRIHRVNEELKTVTILNESKPSIYAAQSLKYPELQQFLCDKLFRFRTDQGFLYVPIIEYIRAVFLPTNVLANVILVAGELQKLLFDVDLDSEPPQIHFSLDAPRDTKSLKFLSLYLFRLFSDSSFKDAWDSVARFRHLKPSDPIQCALAPLDLTWQVAGLPIKDGFFVLEIKEIHPLNPLPAVERLEFTHPMVRGVNVVPIAANHQAKSALKQGQVVIEHAAKAGRGKSKRTIEDERYAFQEVQAPKVDLVRDEEVEKAAQKVVVQNTNAVVGAQLGEAVQGGQVQPANAIPQSPNKKTGGKDAPNQPSENNQETTATEVVQRTLGDFSRMLLHLEKRLKAKVVIGPTQNVAVQIEQRKSRKIEPQELEYIVAEVQVPNKSPVWILEVDSIRGASNRTIVWMSSRPVSDELIQSLIPRKIGFQGHWKIDEVITKFRFEGIPYVLVRHDLKNTKDEALKKWAFTIAKKIIRLQKA